MKENKIKRPSFASLLVIKVQWQLTVKLPPAEMVCVCVWLCGRRVEEIRCLWGVWRFISPLVWFTLLTVSIPAYSLSVQHSYFTQMSAQGHTLTQNRQVRISEKKWTVWKSGDLFLPNRYRTASWAQSDAFRWLLLSSQLSKPPPKV